MTAFGQSLRESVAGAMVFVTGGVIASSTVLYGESMTYNQLLNPLLGGPLTPFSVGAVVLLTLILAMVVLFALLGAINSFESPRLFGRTEYTLVGGGGLFGSVVAVLVSVSARNPTWGISGLPIPAGVGQSGFALAVMALPTGYLFYHLWRPDSAHPRTRASADDAPDPEFVRRQRVVWAEDADPSNPPGPTPSIPAAQRPGPADSDGVPHDSAPYVSGGVDYDELEYNWRAETGVSLADVGGMQSLKQELKTDIIQPLTSGKEKAEAFDIPLPNAILHGPPGTGKTFLAEALATELDLPFAQLTGSDVQSMWINESASKINTLFQEAKAVAASEGGAVIFLDELDAVLKRRSGGGSAHEEDNKVVNEFLAHLQDTSEHDILFLGATNRIDSLDPAAVRAGRIDKTIHVGQPDHDARVAILRAQLSNRPHNLDGNHIDRIAEQTEGLVAADLESLVVSAARISAYHREAEHIEWEDMNAALER